MNKENFPIVIGFVIGITFLAVNILYVAPLHKRLNRHIAYLEYEVSNLNEALCGLEEIVCSEEVPEEEKESLEDIFKEYYEQKNN